MVCTLCGPGSGCQTDCLSDQDRSCVAEEAWRWHMLCSMPEVVGQLTSADLADSLVRAKLVEIWGAISSALRS